MDGDKINTTIYDVAALGILVADIMAKPVDGMPQKGLLNLVDSIEMFNGGNAMTAAVNLKTMGFSSVVMGKVGKDPFGDFLLRRMREAGLDTDGVAVDSKVQTSTSVVLSSADGERSFLHCIGANGTFGLEDVNWDVVKKSRIVFVTGTFLLSRFDGKQTAEFLRHCKELGKVTALDVCWDSSGRWGELLDQAMPYLDFFLPSMEEAEKIAGCQKDAGQLSAEELSEQIASVFFCKGVGSVVIKMGKRGCFAQENSGSAPFLLPAYSSIDVVDTTGAGDSFCSGFLAAWAKGEPFAECVRFANAAGAHCVMKKGATTGMKSYEEIKKFMEETPL